MSAKNVEILRSLYAEMPFDPLTVRPDLLEEFFDPEIEWTGPREFPDLGETHHGYVCGRPPVLATLSACGRQNTEVQVPRPGAVQSPAKEVIDPGDRISLLR